MSLLTWRNATYRDQKALQSFRCTEEDLRMEVSALGLTPAHPRMWEFQVQEHIQNTRIPSSKQWIFRVGVDVDLALGGVLMIQSVTRGEHYDFACGAIAMQLRDGTFTAADSLMQDGAEQIVAHCLDLGMGGTDVLVTTQIHRDNHASKFMCGRAKYTFVQMDPADAEYEIWSCTLPVPAPGLFDS